VLIRRLFMVAVVVALSGCAIEGQDAPALSGPSDYGQSITMTATPDLILPETASVVSVNVRDDQGNALAGVGLRLRLAAGSGSISVNAGTTDAGGNFSVTYLAPSSDTVATIEVSTIGTNGQVQRTRTVAVRVRS
jgi:hypothetical protein